MADWKQTRRAALRCIGATAATAGLTTGVAAQDNETETENESGDDATGDGRGGNGGETDRRPIILAGRTEYWYGIAPEAIEGEGNPTLNLEDGQMYELVWINVDGAEHELILETEEGEELEESESSETAGEAVSMTFEASEDAAEYYCEYHPESMRGGVEFGDGFDLSADNHDDHGGEDGGGNETARDSGNETAGEGMGC